jgi:hypothetical protein
VRPSDKLGGPRPGGSIQPRKWPAARERDALAARLPRVVHACDGAVAHSSAARWWLANGKVLSMSSWGARGGRRARRSGAELTRTAVRHGGGGEVSGQRHSSVGRELRWPVVMEARSCSVGAEEGR